MKKMSLTCILFLVFTIGSFNSLCGQNLTNQLDTLLVKSQDYKNLKLVEKKELLNLKASLGDVERRLESYGDEIQKKKEEIEGLKQVLAKAEMERKATPVVTSISFLGIPVDVVVYHSMMWSFVLFLIVSFFYAVSKFKKANAITKNSKMILSDLEDEFESFKRNAMERELRLQRQLLNEVNKQQKMVDVE